MKTIVPALMLAALLLAAFPSRSPGACTVCHSKDPKMVHMHSALNFEKCFDCHGPAAAPLDRNRRPGDLRCAPCHKS